MTESIRSTTTIATLILALLVAACGSTAPAATSSAVAAIPSASASASPPAAPTAGSTAAPSATAAPTTSAPAAPTPSGDVFVSTGRIEIPDKGFAMTLPDGWTRIDLSSADLGSLMAAAGETNPELAKALTSQMQALVASGLVLFALGPDPTTGTNLNVLQIPSAGLTLDLLEQVNTPQVKSLASGDVTVERVKLPAGDAIHYVYALPMQGVEKPVSINQYILVGGGKAYIVSITGGAETDAKAIVESVEIAK